MESTKGMDPRNLPGSLKAAILIQALGKEASQRIISGLTDGERKIVHDHLNQMGPVAPILVENIAKEFSEKLKQLRTKQLPHNSQSGSVAKSVEGLDNPEEDSNLKAILSLEPEQLFDLIKDEHPQTIAIVMVHMGTETASDVMSRMPDELKTEVAVRIANLDRVSSGMVEEINCVFEEILKTKGTSVTRVTGGAARLAEILNQTDEYSSEFIMNEIEGNNPELADKVKQMMFVFEDLVLVDDRGFQKLLRRIETVELATALKAASDEIKDKVFRNMSGRAGDMLREEMDNLGPVRMTDVTDAQQKITMIVQDMETKGEVVIGGRRGEEFVG
jgi:flagellar motor switch protein FliG